MTMAASTASAAPSVAVTTPPKMPPRISAGRISAQEASLNAAHTRGQLNFSSTGKLYTRAKRYAMTIINRPPRTPGTTPPTNSLTTDVSAIAAYRIIGIDGGMITASVAEEDSTAAENSLEYPLLFIAGIKIDPSAAASATAEPEISAKN